MKRQWIKAAVLTGVAVVLPAWSSGSPSPDTPRGEMLYTTHCIACHTTQVHWRENRLAENWSSLNAQVRRWQSNEQLSWNDDDIRAVARYLNKLYYHFPEDEKAASSRPAEKP